ncbi:regulatory protein, MerR [Leucobacter sp. 7(1)]|uniref:MerR family transcriptional regulator n=1 Tax=Leucobacter sp. 7(1) TaxID=1255613 RepID=UPI00097E94D7|nr:MerR family transcriptional regulator [Leucobacter sp. 7(1)]SJN11927.1 regulatory protein, MerR [Leucobacter sp. 7(1)]
MPEGNMMHIGELAERTQLSLRTIRHYDEIDLLTPSGRSDGGFRLYTDGDFERLMLIRRMKPLGYSLEQMRDLLHAIESAGEQGPGMPESSSDARSALSDFRSDARERRAKLAQQLEMADEFLTLLEARIP